MRVSINAPIARLSLEMDETQATRLMAEALMSAVPIPAKQNKGQNKPEKEIHEGDAVAPQKSETAEGAPP